MLTLRLKRSLIPLQLFISAALFVVSTQSWAYPVEGYVGLGTGYGWTDTRFSDPSVDQFGTRETPSYTDVENPNLPWNIYTGLRFSPYYGIELGYVSFPRIEFEKTLEQRDNNTGELLKNSERDASIHASGLTLSHVFYLPLFWNINVSAKAGLIFGTVAYNDTEVLQQPRDTGNGVEFVTSESDDSSERSLTTAHLSLAANWRASKNWAVRWQIEQLQFEHDEEKEEFTQWLSSLSAQYHF